jgi:hypothetical protein
MAVKMNKKNQTRRSQPASDTFAAALTNGARLGGLPPLTVAAQRHPEPRAQNAALLEAGEFCAWIRPEPKLNPVRA